MSARRLPLSCLSRAVVLMLALLPLACRSADELTEQESAAVDRTLDVMNRRLALMADVAKVKWKEQPISDPEREAKLLDAIARRAEQQGMDAAFSREVVAAQVAAAKLVQQAHFERWRNEGRGRFDDAVTLASLRTRIDDVTRDLLDAADALRPMLGRARVRRALEVRAASVLADVSPEARAAAMEPLLR